MFCAVTHSRTRRPGRFQMQFENISRKLSGQVSSLFERLCWDRKQDRKLLGDSTGILESR